MEQNEYQAALNDMDKTQDASEFLAAHWDAVRQALAQAAAPQAFPQGWMPIKTAPRGENLLFYEGGHHYSGMRHTNNCFSATCAQPVVCQPEPTHWMLLPAAPFQKESDT